MGGGGKGGSKAPAAPDYAAAAVAQGQMDRETARQITSWNRPNQTDQYGNQVSWTFNPMTNQWDQKVTMSGSGQAAANQMNQAGSNLATNFLNAIQNPKTGIGATQQNIANQMKTAQDYKAPTVPDAAKYGNFKTPDANSLPWALNSSAVPAPKPTTTGTNSVAPGATTTGGNTTIPGQTTQANTNALPGQSQYGNFQMPTYDQNSGKAVSDATYKQMTDRLIPQQQRDSEAMQNQLRMQGLQPGTAAYDRAYQNLLTSQGDVLSGAANQATISGYNEARNQYLAQLQGQGQAFGQDFAKQNELFGQGMQQFQGNLTQQQQAYNQGTQNLQNQLAQQQQMYNQNQGQFLNNLTGQNQAFNQSQQWYGANLGAQNQAFQQGTQNFQNQLGLQNQQFQQDYMKQNSLFDQLMQRQNTQFGQDTYLQNRDIQNAQGQMANLANLQQMAQAGQIGPQFQGFSGATGYNPTDLMGATNASYAAKMSGYNANQAKKGGLLNAGAGLGGALLGGKF